MKYTVFGPMTRADQTAHVHKAGCADCNSKEYKREERHTVEAETPIAAAFAAVLDEDLGYTASDAKVFPCCGWPFTSTVDSTVEVSVSGKAMSARCWDGGYPADDNDPADVAFAAEFNKGKYRKSGRGWSHVVTLSREHAKYLAHDLREYGETISGEGDPEVRADARAMLASAALIEKKLA